MDRAWFAIRAASGTFRGDAQTSEYPVRKHSMAGMETMKSPIAPGRMISRFKNPA
jgi:hypothetical protein